MVVARMLKDIDLEIEAIEMRIDQLQREHYSLEKIRDTHKMDVMSYIQQKARIEKALECLYGTLEDMEQTRDGMISKMKDMSSIEQQVACRRYGEKKSLKEIALELGITYIYAREVSANVKKKMGDGLERV